MKMKGIAVKSIVYGVVALMIVFLVFGALVMPYFSSAWRFAQDVCLTPSDTGDTVGNCTYDKTANTTVIVAGDHICTGNDENSTAGIWCQKVQTAGGYRISTQGLLLLILVMALVGTALYFLRVGI